MERRFAQDWFESGLRPERAPNDEPDQRTGRADGAITRGSPQGLPKRSFIVLMGGVHVCTPEDASIGFPMSAMPLYAHRAMGVKALLLLLQGLHSGFACHVML